VTNVLDEKYSRQLLMVEGRGVQALRAFAEALRETFQAITQTPTASLPKLNSGE
jgi:hypothetical protein